ncbi:MAG: ferredoxin [Chitinophagales bacterium]|jgi:ferredoxin|nr:ferredoxin [Chitinophagales bacterium]
MIRILQHREKCIGCHACVDAAPQRWRVSRRDGKCTLVGGVEKRGWFKALVEEEELESNLRAANNCPVKIIRVENQ